MRSTFFLACFLLLAAFPALAQSSSKIIAGSYTCGQKVPCNGDSFSPAAWAQYGNGCIDSAFGYTNPDGIVDEIAGLDGNNCLTTKPGSVAKGAGPQLLPHCCVIKSPSDSCVIHCNLEQQ